MTDRADDRFERLLGRAADALANGEGPVIYVHPEVGAPSQCCVVDQEWLARVWEAACEGGYEDPSLTAAGVRDRFLPHSHVDPEDLLYSGRVLTDEAAVARAEQAERSLAELQERYTDLAKRAGCKRAECVVLEEERDEVVRERDQLRERLADELADEAAWRRRSGRPVRKANDG